MNIDSVCDALSKTEYPPRRVCYFDLTDSTNRQARLSHKERDTHEVRERASGIGEIFIAGGQTAGRGRLDRTFVSVHGAGLYFTVKLKGDEVKRPEALTPTVAVAAAERLGLKEEAKRLTEKYLCATEDIFDKTERLWEKYNAETGGLDVKAEYDTPEMLGWSAGVYMAFYRYRMSGYKELL